MEDKSLINKSTRLKSIDSFRGFAVISMIIANYIALYDAIPSYFKHARGVGLTVIDLIAPFFLFTIGLTYRNSYLKRKALFGQKKAVFHMILRYFYLFLIGVIGVCVAKAHFTTEWGVLQAIGCCGLIALPFIEFKFWTRLSIALVLLVSYQYLLFPNIHNTISDAKHGGLYGTIAWASLLLLATSAGDLLKPNNNKTSMKNLFLYGLSFSSLGIIWQWMIPISKIEVNMTYILVSTGISCLTFIFFFFIYEILKVKVSILQILGKNALIIYLVHYILVSLSHIIIRCNAGLILIICGACVIYFLCLLLAWFLDWKNLYIKL